MKITVLGFIVMISCVSYCMRYRNDIFKRMNFKKHLGNSLLFTTALSLFVDAGIVMQFATMQITVLEFCFYILFLTSIYSILFIKLSKQQVIYFLLAIAFIIMNNSLLVLRPTSIQTVTLPNLWYDYFINGVSNTPVFGKSVIIFDIYILMAITILFSIKNTFNSDDFQILGCNVGKFVYLGAGIVFLEIILKLIFGIDEFYEIRRILMGINVDSVSTIVRGGFSTYYGFNSEPASFSHSIFLCVLLVNLTSDEFKIIPNLVVVILGLLSGSMLFLVYLFFLIVQLIVLNFSYIKTMILSNFRKVLIVIILFSTFSIFFFFTTGLLDYFIVRLSNVIDIFLGNEIEYSSELSRITTSMKMFIVFLDRPIFGAGIGTTYGFSAIMSSLSNVGIVGAIGFVAIIKTIVHDYSNKKVFVFHLCLVLVLLTIQGSIASFVFVPAYTYLLIVKNAALHKKKE